MFDSESTGIENLSYTRRRRLVVNRYDEEELIYWTSYFRCTPGELLHAIGVAGVSVYAIESYVEKQLNGTR